MHGRLANGPLPASPLQRLFWPALILALAIMVVFGIIDAPLHTPAAAKEIAPGIATSGIVAYELAGSVTAAQAMIDSWDARARLYAAFGLGLDYLYMPSYALAIALGCLWARRRLAAHRPRLAALGLALAWGLGAAALLDATENFALLKMLLAGAAAAPWPALAAACATVKFLLVVAGLLYALAGAASWAVGRLQGRKEFV